MASCDHATWAIQAGATAAVPSGVIWSDRQPADPPEVPENLVSTGRLNWRRHQLDGPVRRSAHGVLTMPSTEIDRSRGLAALPAPQLDQHIGKRAIAMVPK